MNDKIKNWYLARGVSEKILTSAGISFNGQKIVIPIRDVTGRIIFNKYRKNPFVNSDEPKYTYDFGASGALFNAHTITHNSIVFITEGEGDALLMNSLGLEAVSSTGGSGTFKKEWADFLNDKASKIYICYDKDASGYKGAVKVQQLLPKAKIVCLPYTLKGKDITDFFLQYKMADFVKLVNESENWLMPIDSEEIPKTKTGVDKIIKEINSSIENFNERRNNLNNEGKITDHVDIIIDMLEKRSEVWKSIRKNLGIKKDISGSEVQKAKSFPINKLLKFSPSGFTKCIFHNDNSPSLKYYSKSNMVHCFSCEAHKDVIDVYMQIHGCTFKEALQALTS